MDERVGYAILLVIAFWSGCGAIALMRIAAVLERFYKIAKDAK